MGRYLFIVLTIYTIILHTYGCGSKGSKDIDSSEGITWSKTFGMGYDDSATSIQQTSDGGYIVAGYSYGTQDEDLLVIKLNSYGNLIWDRTFGGLSDERATSIQQTSDGGYIVAGYTKSYGAGNGDFWVIKLDSDGEAIWDKTFGDDVDFEMARSIKQTSDGGYIVTGKISFVDTWVIKLDSNGNLLWDKVFGGRVFNWASSIQQTSDGGYILAGSTIQSDQSLTDVWVIKLNKDGDMMWEKIFGGDSNGSDTATSIQQTSDGEYIVAGSKQSRHSGGDLWVIKLDSNGNIIWDKTYIERHHNEATSIYQTLDGGYIVAGAISWQSWISGVGWQWQGSDFWIIKIDSTGNLVWDKTFGGDGDDWPNSIQQTSDGGYVIAGATSSNRASYDCWIIKLNSDGDVSQPEMQLNPVNHIEL